MLNSKRKPKRKKESSAKTRPALDAKLNQCLDALRRIRKALRLRKHVEDLAAQAQAAIAKHTAQGQTAPRSLRDYRLRANVHITQISKALEDLITRTADIEDLLPRIPGRSSPPAKTPQTLGEPPVAEPTTSAPATEIPDFSRPFSSSLTPISGRAKKAAQQTSADSEDPAEETPPRRRRRTRE